MAINREMIGKALSPTTFEVERGKIREFASAIGDTNPIYHEIEAARETGYADLPIPPTFPTTFSNWGKKTKMPRPKIWAFHLLAYCTVKRNTLTLPQFIPAIP